MTVCSVKQEVACRDEPTENYPPTLQSPSALQSALVEHLQTLSPDAAGGCLHQTSSALPRQMKLA